MASSPVALKEKASSPSIRRTRKSFTSPTLTATRSAVIFPIAAVVKVAPVLAKEVEKEALVLAKDPERAPAVLVKEAEKEALALEKEAEKEARALAKEVEKEALARAKEVEKEALALEKEVEKEAPALEKEVEKALAVARDLARDPSLSPSRRISPSRTTITRCGGKPSMAHAVSTVAAASVLFVALRSKETSEEPRSMSNNSNSKSSSQIVHLQRCWLLVKPRRFALRLCG